VQSELRFDIGITQLSHGVGQELIMGAQYRFVEGKRFVSAGHGSFVRLQLWC